MPWKQNPTTMKLSLDKRVPQNPRLSGVGPKLNTGPTVDKARVCEFPNPS